jgi:hypothetical protein
MLMLHNRVFWRSEGRSASLQNTILLTAFVLETLWIGVTGIIGWRVVAMVLRLLA